jgi:transcriptional regulator with GAF, ATPase, and Fis domain
MNAAAVYSCGCGQSSAAGQCLNALQGAGVRVENQEEKRARHSVLLFDEPSEEVCCLLREMCGSGKSRVLAVGLSGALRAGETDSLLSIGAADVLIWKDSEQNALAGRIKAMLDRWATVDALLDSGWLQRQMVGGSSCWRAKLRELVEAGRFTDFPVLLTGESGTGKELAARLIHELDQRPKKKAFVVVDCTTLTPELAGSELFGHEKGAFTGAAGQREGAFALADKGTLFLDEIGELPLPLQAQLLRALQEHSYKRVGGNTWQQSEFRLICATNRNLEEEVRQGRFRADLYYRIAGLTCALPPLRERTEDILPLVRHFIRELRPNEDAPELDEAVQAYFLCHDYPGNVRELKQRVMRLLHRYAGGGLLSIGCIPPNERLAGHDRLRSGEIEQIIRRALATGRGLKEIGQTAEDMAVRIAVEDAGGSLQRAAQALGITDRALQLRRAKERQIRAAGLMPPARSIEAGCR